MASRFIKADATVLDFIRFDGDGIRPGDRVRDVTRGAINGSAVKRLGTRGEPFAVIGVRDVTAADLNTKVNAWRALQGTIVTWENSAGLSYTQIAVLRVPQPEIIPIISPVGGKEGAGGAWLVRQRFVLLDTKTA